MIDFHSHIIPGVDDGSETIEQSLTALRNMLEQGITHVITTPHFSASTLNQPREFSERIKHVDIAWGALRDAADKELPELRLDRGAEVALDEPLKLAPDDRMRLAGTRFVLVEFPYFVAPPHSPRVLTQFRQLGVTPIIAHPERYKEMAGRLEMLREWKIAGAYLQLNAGSLIGAYGSEVQSTGWKVLEAGLADYICSDYHARGDCLSDAARQQIEARHADSQFRILSTMNGERLVAGIDPVPVEPVTRRETKWRRVARALRGSR